MRPHILHSLAGLILAASLLTTGCANAEVQPTDPPSTTTNTAPSTPEQPPASPEAATPTQPNPPDPAAPQPVPDTCPLTPPDALGPFYVPGAPVREKVGVGYVLSGVVRSASDCSPVQGAQIEFWLAGPEGDYGDDWRATLFSLADGTYRFESHPPPPYSGRPPHIHIQVSAPGFDTLVTQHYPTAGVNQATMDLVLIPID